LLGLIPSFTAIKQSTAMFTNF